MSDGPLYRYRQLVADGTLERDPVQELAAEKLQSLHHALVHYQPTSGKQGWFARFGKRDMKRDEAPQGLYLVGDVGRGKSMLMMLLFDTVPLQKKMRVHFHELMRDVQDEIHRLRQLPINQDGDPIPGIANGIADQATLLCLDEMEVRDIADAMIVGRLFEHLFARGVVVVTTSNRYPDDLYKDGLQRDRFLPFIGLIKEKLDVLGLEAKKDYRLGRAAGMEVYHSPLDEAADAALDTAFAVLTDNAPAAPDDVTVAGRTITTQTAAKGVARFDFNDLCATALGPRDYMALAKHYRVIVLRGVPKMDAQSLDKARRFVTLVDAFYDRRGLIVCSADAPPEQLYTSGDGAFEFQRTASRLLEMQAKDYLDDKT